VVRRSCDAVRDLRNTHCCSTTNRKTI
jgi:hypothetical protein